MKFKLAHENALAFRRYRRSPMAYVAIVQKYAPHKQRANHETCNALRRAIVEPPESVTNGY